jgi:hypothetical protein
MFKNEYLLLDINYDDFNNNIKNINITNYDIYK